MREGQLCVSLGVLLLLVCMTSQDDGHFQAPDRQDWIDPTDMIYDVEQQKKDREARRKLAEEETAEPIGDKQSRGSQSHDAHTHGTCTSRDTQQCRDRLRACEKQVQALSAPETPYFRQYVKSLQGHLRDVTTQIEAEGEVAVCVEMLLSPEILEELRKFTDAGGPVQGAHGALVDAISGARPADPHPSWFALGLEWGTQHIWMICLIMATMALVSLALSMQIRYRVPWVSLFYKLLIVLFVLSIPWNWWHLYKLESAKRYADMLQEVPPDCKPKHQQSLWEAFVNSLSLDVDACTKYHQRMMTDPMWEVPPTKALAVTFTKFAVEPVEHIGSALNTFLQKTLHGLPVYLWPVAIFFAILILLLVMVMTFGYRLNLFYLFGIEPGQPGAGLRERQLQLEHGELQNQHAAVQNENNRLKRELQQTQMALEESRLVLDAPGPAAALLPAPPPYPRQHVAMPPPQPRQVPAESLGPRDEADAGSNRADDIHQSRGAQAFAGGVDVRPDAPGAVVTSLPPRDGSGDRAEMELRQRRVGEGRSGSPQTKATLEAPVSQNETCGTSLGEKRDTEEEEKHYPSGDVMHKIKPKLESIYAGSDAAKEQSDVCDKARSDLVNSMSERCSVNAAGRHDDSVHAPLDLTVAKNRVADGRCADADWSSGNNGGKAAVTLETLHPVDVPSTHAAPGVHCDPEAESQGATASPEVEQEAVTAPLQVPHSGSGSQSVSVPRDVHTLSPNLYSAGDDGSMPADTKLPIQEEGCEEGDAGSESASYAPSTVGPIPCSSLQEQSDRGGE